MLYCYKKVYFQGDDELLVKVESSIAGEDVLGDQPEQSLNHDWTQLDLALLKVAPKMMFYYNQLHAHK